MTTVTEGKIQSMLAMVSQAETIAILTHLRPDGDAIGSTSALQRFLKDICGKDSVIILSSPIPESLRFIGHDDAIEWDGGDGRAARTIASADLIFCLDCANLGRCDMAGDAAGKSGARKILIDHHLNPATGEFDLVFSEPECVSSASELLYYMMMAVPAIGGDASKIPPHSRRALLAGMTTDTNNFANSVHPTTFQMASDLIAAGTDRDEVLGHIYNEYRENRFRAMGFMLHERMNVTEKGVAYMIMDQATRDRYDLRDGETEGLVNMPLGIDGVKISIMLTEDGDKYRVSIRSKEGWSANQLAVKYFNGGGHEQAAGGRLYVGKDIARTEDAESYLLRIIEES